MLHSLPELSPAAVPANARLVGVAGFGVERIPLRRHPCGEMLVGGNQIPVDVLHPRLSDLEAGAGGADAARPRPL